MAGGFMMSAAWQHNPQSVFHSDGYIAWADLLGIGAGWFMVIFWAALPIFLVLFYVIKWIYGRTAIRRNN